MDDSLGPAPRVVIVGAGFAGLAAVRTLSGSGADITLVDRNIYSTFQPLLYQVATGGLNPGDVAYPIRGFAHRQQVHFRHGTVASIETAEGDRRVVLVDGTTLDYDYLVLATGATANYFGVPGAAEHSLSIYTRAEAIAVRDHLMGRLERLSAGGGADELSVVVVGGGATGVEMAGTLAELRGAGLAVAFPEIEPRRFSVVLVEQGPELLAPFHPSLRDYTRRELEQRGVDVRVRATIEEVHEDRVTLVGGEQLPAAVTVWAAGVTVGPAVAAWGLPQGPGSRLRVRPDLRVEGHDRVFAVGDMAATDESPWPQLAQPALQTGKHAGRQIARRLRGEPTVPFRYRDKGTMATIGRRSAIVQLPGGVHLTGTVAWLVWLALHIVTLLGGRNRASALLNLSWRYLAWPGGSGVIVGDAPEFAVDDNQQQQN